jgi:hypothetical protein
LIIVVSKRTDGGAILVGGDRLFVFISWREIGADSGRIGRVEEGGKIV